MSTFCSTASSFPESMSTSWSSASSSAESRCSISTIDSVSVRTLDTVSSSHPTEILFSLLVTNLFVSSLTLLICSGCFDAGGEEGWLILSSASRDCIGTDGSLAWAFDIVSWGGRLTASAARSCLTCAACTTVVRTGCNIV